MKKGSRADDGYFNSVVLLPFKHDSEPIFFDDVKEAAAMTGKDVKSIYSYIKQGTRMNYLGKKWFVDYEIL